MNKHIFTQTDKQEVAEVKIPFNKPYLTGSETYHIENAMRLGKLSGNGVYTEKCHQFFRQRFGFDNCLLTTSCTDALEMSAILADIKQGDEVIIPSYTFVSSANPFLLRGAKVVFADSRPDQPCMNESTLEALITPKTKAIVVVHYAGVACNMGKIMQLADKYGLIVIEDAAQAIDGYYLNKPLGSIGHLAAFSFHDTKNITCGEGGMLVVNDERLKDRAEIIREKGTNRSKFFRGEIDKYGWVDIGSSFLPSEITAAFLYAQLESLDEIKAKRRVIWKRYYKGLLGLDLKGHIRLPEIPQFSNNNAHMFYIVCKSLEERTRLISYLKQHNIQAVFHYLSLHKSDYYADKHDGRELSNSDLYTDRLLRLPFFTELTEWQQERVISRVLDFYLR